MIVQVLDRIDDLRRRLGFIDQDPSVRFVVGNGLAFGDTLYLVQGVFGKEDGIGQINVQGRTREQ